MFCSRNRPAAGTRDVLLFAHRAHPHASQVARWDVPHLAYVSVTGVIVYAMLAAAKASAL